MSTKSIATENDSNSLDENKNSVDNRYPSIRNSYYNRCRNSVLTNDYESLKQQCDLAVEELGALQAQHNETTRRYDRALKELNYYKILCRTNLRMSEESDEDYVQKLFSEFFSQDNNKKDVLFSSLRRNDVRESFRKRYNDLLNKHKLTVQELKNLQNENAALNQKCDNAFEEKNSLKRECAVLKQQCTAAIRQWDAALKERNDFQEAYNKSQRRHEEIVKEVNEIMSLKLLSTNDIARLQDERDAAVREHRLVMAERDGVHKEIENLQLDITLEQNKLKKLEQKLKTVREHNQLLLYTNETLRREITSALHDRDEAIRGHKEVQAILEKNNTELASCKALNDSLNGIEGVVMDRQSFNQFESMRNELKTVKDVLANVSLKLSEAIEEAEVARGRRDWAFSERDKIVFEKENLLSICEKLRIERDRATTDVTLALQNLDVAKKKTDTDSGKQLNQDSEQQRRDNSSCCTCKNNGDVATYNNLIVTRLPSKTTHGLTLSKGFYISKISVENMPAKECSLAVGDRVLSINNRNVNCFKDAQDAMMYLNNNYSDIVIITTQRSFGLQKDNRNLYYPPKKVNCSTQTGEVVENDDDEFNDFDKVLSSVCKNGDFTPNFKLRPMPKPLYRPSSTKTNDVDESKKYNNVTPPDKLVAENKSNVKNAEHHAIAELDSVLEKYHYQRSVLSDSFQQRIQQLVRQPPNYSDVVAAKAAKEANAANEENNGGTWPRTRANLNVANNLVSTVSVPKKKERAPLSVLFSKNDEELNYPSKDESTKGNQSGSSDTPKSKLPTIITNTLNKIKRQISDHSKRYSIATDTSIDYSLNTHLSSEEYEKIKKSKTPKSSHVFSDFQRIPSSRYSTPYEKTDPSKGLMNFPPVRYMDKHRPLWMTKLAANPLHLEPFLDTSVNQFEEYFRVDIEDPVSWSGSAEEYDNESVRRLKSTENSNTSSTVSAISKPMGSETAVIQKRADEDRTLTRDQIPDLSDVLKSINLSQQSNLEKARYVNIETPSHSNLGISLVGGNAVGIFIDSVGADSLAARSNLKVGDHILEYNGVSFRSATAEQAAYEFAKPAVIVTLLVQYNFQKYDAIKDFPCDSLYIRCACDRSSLDLSDSYHLTFYKDDILFVDSTMFNGIPGHWRAWKLDHDGNKKKCGIIPSKHKVDELLLRRNINDSDGRTSTSTRRSFFRKKKHSRNDSNDSKELASFQSSLFGWSSDSSSLNEEFPVYSYERVEKVDYPTIRPVLILGPLSDSVAEKLFTDFPDRFQKCLPEISQYSDQDYLERHNLIDFKRRGDAVECTTIQCIESVCNQKLHCVIDVSIMSIEKLHQVRIYPIVILIKFKSTKQIRETKDSLNQIDKVSSKAAKEMFEHGLKLEAEHKHYISAIIPAGSNIAYLSTQVKTAVDIEQNKSVWVPCKSQL